MIMTPIAPHVTAFLRKHLPIERRRSQNTCDTYAYALQLLFEFASGRLRVEPSALQLEHINAQLILAFLDHCREHRGNGPSTCNGRLAAIKSFMRFLQHRVPSSLDDIRRVLAVPIQKTDQPLTAYLTEDEQQALLDAMDPTTRTGLRDRALCHLAIAGGLRVSELVGLRMDDLDFRENYVDVLVRGKGRKQRVLPLWKEVAASLRAWLAVRGRADVPEVFLNRCAGPLGRSGVTYILKRVQDAAATTCASLTTKAITPHVLRHSCGMNVLRATGDIRKVALWLGHEQTQTTEVYLHGNVTDRLEVLGAVVPPSLRPGKFRPPDKLIASLRGDRVMRS